MQRIFINLIMVCMCCTCVLLNGCQADVDLNNIDTSTSIHANVGIPLGNTTICLGDFLGDSTLGGLTVDTLNRYVYSDTMSTSYDFYSIDILEYIEPTKISLCIDDILLSALGDLPSIPDIPGLFDDIYDLGLHLPAGQSFAVDIPIQLDISAMNNDLEHQRLDSILVKLVDFTATLSLENINLSWQDIQKMDITFGNGFKCSGSNIVSIPTANGDFDRDFSIKLQDCGIILVEDPTRPLGADNMLETLDLTLHLEFYTHQELALQRNQNIVFGISLKDLEFDAIYGYFDASDYMHLSVTDMPLSDLWSSWSALDGLVLPIREPSIMLCFEHALSLPLLIHINSFSVSSGDEERYACFNGRTFGEFRLPAKIALDAPLNTRAKDTIVLDYTPERGNLSELFKVHPDNISYDFSIEGDTTEQKQFRITNDMKMDVTWAVNVPFEFNEGIQISYSDTIANLQLDMLQLDSLLAEVSNNGSIDTADLHLYLTIENWIPFDISGHFTLHDKDHGLVQLSNMESKTIDLHLSYPENKIVDGLVVEPSKNIISLTFHKEDFAKLASIEHIILTAELGQNKDVVKLTPDASLHINAGVTANIDAVIDIFNLLE